MKRWMLEALAQHWRQYRSLRSVVRVTDNVLRLDFDKATFEADLTRGQGLIYPAEPRTTTKHYKAPFDQMLARRFTQTAILEVTADPHDRVLLMRVENRQGYKAARITLRLEFTGRHTNAIILDEAGLVLEAWRQIGSESSSRIVRVGEPLAPIPPRPLKERPPDPLPPIEALLRTLYQERADAALARAKEAKLSRLHHKIDTLRTGLSVLPDAATLQTEAQTLTQTGHLLLAHLHLIRPYDKRVTLTDFDGTERTIDLPILPTVSMIPEYFFTRAKKMRQKAQGVHLECENLSGLELFYRRLADATRHAASLAELSLLHPPLLTTKEKEEKSGEVAVFLIRGQRILIGRNERGNQSLLRRAKAGDVWMHLKDRPSAHLILPTAKQNLPEELLFQAARLLVSLSTDQVGSYLVDYTYRRYVRPQEGAKVLYTHYKTLNVTKEQ